MDPGVLNPILDKIGVPGDAHIIGHLDATPGLINSGQSNKQKLIASLVARVTVGRFMMLPPTLWPKARDCPKGSPCFQAAECYGTLKKLALEEEGEKVRAKLVECGGKAMDLTDEELVQIWGANEHHNLHAILVPGGPVGNAVHATSLNDNPGDGTGDVVLGGYNDKGAYPQWGWLEAAHGLFPLLGIPA